MKKNFENQMKQFIKSMNTSKPEEFLSDCIKVTTPQWKDLNRISMAKDYGGLPDSVINVLIHYVMLTTEVDTLNQIFNDIAVEWSKKGIKTTEEAMLLAKQEHKKYQEWLERYDEDRILGSVLRGAIITGMTDEQLGRYVRELQKKHL